MNLIDRIESWLCCPRRARRRRVARNLIDRIESGPVGPAGAHVVGDGNLIDRIESYDYMLSLNFGTGENLIDRIESPQEQRPGREAWESNR